MLDLIKDMLPEGNEIPVTTYEAKQNVCPLRLEVERIHACKNDCVLFRSDDYEHLTEYPKCGFPRYKRRFDGGDDKRKHGAPYKVAWYFLIYIFVCVFSSTLVVIWVGFIDLAKGCPPTVLLCLINSCLLSDCVLLQISLLIACCSI
jgi:hypothetical protein